MRDQWIRNLVRFHDREDREILTIACNQLPKIEERNIVKVIPSAHEELSNEDLLELNNQNYDQDRKKECEKPNVKIFIT